MAVVPDQIIHDLDQRVQFAGNFLQLFVGALLYGSELLEPLLGVLCEIPLRNRQLVDDCHHTSEAIP